MKFRWIGCAFLLAAALLPATLSLTAQGNSGTFDLGSTLPIGWNTGFSSTTVTLNPGQSGSVTMTKATPAEIAGTYAVNAIVTNGNHAAVTGNANCTVAAAPVAIYFSALTATPNPIRVRNTVTFKAIILKGAGVPVSGATVTFTISRTGGSATKTATTNALGVATAEYKATQRGSYSVTASASSNGSSANGGPAAFTVD